MPYLLNLLYLALVAVASPWLLWIGRAPREVSRRLRRKTLRPRAACATGDEPCVWLHAVSVGEVNLLGVLVKELRRRRPDVRIVISSTTRTGLELARKKYADLTTFYCPLDFSWACRAAMRRVRPSVLVLAELELWPNLIRAAERDRRAGRDRQRSAGREEFSRLPANSAAWCGACCGRSRSSPCRTKNIASGSRDLGADRSDARHHRLAQVRRRLDRSQQPEDAGAWRSSPGISPERRRVPRRQHAGRRRASGARRLSLARRRVSRNCGS